MTIETVDFPIDSLVDLSSSLCQYQVGSSPQAARAPWRQETVKHRPPSSLMTRPSSTCQCCRTCRWSWHSPAWRLWASKQSSPVKSSAGTLRIQHEIQYAWHNTMNVGYNNVINHPYLGMVYINIYQLSMVMTGGWCFFCFVLPALIPNERP